MTNHLPNNGKSYSRANWLPGTAGQQGAVSVALGAALWGLFWIPLRFLDEKGVIGLWAVALVMGILIIPAMLALASTNKLHTLKSTDAWIIGGALGLSTVLYFTGIIVSDVIRVVFLFYLLPVWTTLSARILYNEPITRSRLLVIAIALVGLWLLLGGGNSIPLPSNIGDWCGLLAGACWGVSLSAIRGKEDVDAGAMVCTTAIGATVITLAIALLLHLMGNTELATLPTVDSWPLVVSITLAFTTLLLLPSLVGQVWGAQRIAAPTAALLTMSEILVATVSAYVLVGTELNAISFIGALIIFIAVLIDIAMKYKQAK